MMNGVIFAENLYFYRIFYKRLQIWLHCTKNEDTQPHHWTMAQNQYKINPRAFFDQTRWFFFANGVDFTEFLLQMCSKNVYFFSKTWRAGRIKLIFFGMKMRSCSWKKLESKKVMRAALHCEICIWNIQIRSLLIFVVFTRGIPGQFLNFLFTTELAP